jgi:aldehyde:ferredoxin oxidoreductase
MVVTKSPLNNFITSSNSGGYFPSELKYAGYDMIIIEGKSERPVYIAIYNDKVEIRGATNIWGKTTFETEEIIKREFHNDAKIACIGPAGEKQVLFSCIINDKYRAAGRSGVGAVMGSKNLKAIAVRGTGGVKISDKNAFRKAAQVTYSLIKKSPVTAEGLPKYGTAVLVNIIHESGLMPVNNFLREYIENVENISGERIAETILKRNKACMSCIIGCGRVAVVRGEKEVIGEGPEYEPIWSMGADCGITDLDAITKANYICNAYGIDPISAGGTIACAMEMFEKGIITEKDTGMPLNFGNSDAMVKMIEAICKREGFGDVLALGSTRLSEKYGSPEISMGVKKLEFPAYDGRVAQGIGLNYATSNRGACHVRGYTISPEILGVPEKFDPVETQGKAELVKTFQDVTAVVDSVGMCLFTTFALTINEIKDLFNAATGLSYNVDDMLHIGERIWNLERLFNLREGLNPEEDTLPKRLLETPVSEGPNKGLTSRLDILLPEYYKVRGWNKDGLIEKETLQKLNLM